MENFLFDLSVVLVGSALLAFLAVVFKQPIVIAYVLCGAFFGPWGFGWIKHVEFIEGVSHLGITLLLFLAGLCLHPQKLMTLFKKTSIVTLTNCFVSFGLAFGVSLALKFNLTDSMLIGLALMFSSTIMTVKLLPTTKLHQQRMGAVCISVLILQDLLAVMVLVFVRCMNAPQGALLSFGLLFFKMVLLIAGLFLFEYLVLRKIMARVDRIHELLFIFGLSWCFGVASLSDKIGLFPETGAFFAGVVLASHPISFFISEKLKPLRDFFLVLFFFSLGAQLDVLVVKGVLWQAALLMIVLMVAKSWVFKKTFTKIGETPEFSREIGTRLGQLSEFSLLIAALATTLGQISSRATSFIQLVTILSFIVSSYIVVMKFPTPIGTSSKLIRD